MIFINIDATDSTNQAAQLNEHINDQKDVFALFHMDNCPHCVEVVPEWEKIQTIVNNCEDNDNSTPEIKTICDLKLNANIVVAMVNEKSIDKLNESCKIDDGFPTIRYISNGGKKIQNFDGNRTTDEFIKWINECINNSTETLLELKGGRHKRAHTHKRTHTRNCTRTKKSRCKHGKRSNLCATCKKHARARSHKSRHYKKNKTRKHRRTRGKK